MADATPDGVVGGESEPVFNRVLLSLPQNARKQLLATAERRTFPPRERLFKDGGAIDAAYFPETGVISLITLLQDGSSVEAATVGFEGFVAVDLFLGEETVSAAYVTQSTSTCYVIRKDRFRAALEAHAEFRDACAHYANGLLYFMAQTTACNRRHTVQQRCARWTLLMHDRMRTDTFALTQELLATMLGVRRPSVSAAAASLQEAGIIAYRRGRITILNRRALLAASCECYRVIQSHFGD